MGEARRRGTYAERKAAAIVRDGERIKVLRENSQRKGKSSTAATNGLLPVLIAMGAFSPPERENIQEKNNAD